MKLGRILHQGAARLAVSSGEIWRLLPAEFADPTDVLGHTEDPLAHFQALADQARETVGGEELRWLVPIERFRRDVLCVGWNYWDHFEEGIGKRDGQEVERPAAPTFFTKAPASLTGARDPIPWDPVISGKWDYEGEIAVIIGKTGRSIPAERAMEHVFGYMLANDVSQRDLQRRHGGQWLKGKSIDGSSPVGPWIVTADEVVFEDLTIQTFVNGDKRQNATPRLMAFPLPELIAELSFGMTLFAGDIVLTGTPSGVGMARTPPDYLDVGDEIVVRGGCLGETRNRLELADLHGASHVKVG